MQLRPGDLVRTSGRSGSYSGLVIGARDAHTVWLRPLTGQISRAPAPTHDLTLLLRREEVAQLREVLDAGATALLTAPEDAALPTLEEGGENSLHTAIRRLIADELHALRLEYDEGITLTWRGEHLTGTGSL